MKVKIKKLNDRAVIPSYAKPGDAGLDLVATSIDWNHEDQQITYGTGLSFEIPEGFVGLIFPRSSLCKKDLYLSNHVGVIDSGYRGEVVFKFNTDHNVLLSNVPEVYNIGDRIGQIIIVPYPQIEFEEVLEINSSDRGNSGFGSTGS